LTAENKNFADLSSYTKRKVDNTKSALKKYSKDGIRLDRMENCLFLLFWYVCRLYRNNDYINGR